MSSEIDICNLALSELGQTLITSFTDNDKKARLCNVRYPQARDFVLSNAWWTFATKRQTLSRLSETPDSEFEYYYQMPTDCLEPRYLVDSTIEYKIEGDRLITDSTSDIELVYTKKETDTAKFSAVFIEALSIYIAFKIAKPLVNNDSIRDRLEKDYLMMMTRASGIDKRRGKSKVSTTARWVSCRTGGVDNIAKKLTDEV